MARVWHSLKGAAVQPGKLEDEMRRRNEPEDEAPEDDEAPESDTAGCLVSFDGFASSDLDDD